MIVPCDAPGHAPVRFLQIRIGAIEGVAGAVPIQIAWFGRAEIADLGLVGIGCFVNIVADLHDQVGIARQHVAIGAEPSQFPMLAGCERQPQPVGAVRHGCGTPDRAGRAKRMEAIMIGAPRS